MLAIKTPSSKSSPSYKHYKSRVLENHLEFSKYFDADLPNLAVWALTDGQQNHKIYNEKIKNGMIIVFIGLDEIVIGVVVKIDNYPKLTIDLWGDGRFLNTFFITNVKIFKVSHNRIQKIFTKLEWKRSNMKSYKFFDSLDWAKTKHKKYITKLNVVNYRHLLHLKQKLSNVNITEQEGGGIYLIQVTIDNTKYLKIGKYSSTNFLKRMTNYIKECPTNDPSRKQIQSLFNSNYNIHRFPIKGDQNIIERNILTTLKEKLGKPDYGKEYYTYSLQSLQIIQQTICTQCYFTSYA